MALQAGFKLPPERLFDGRAGGLAAAESSPPAVNAPPARGGGLLGPWPAPPAKAAAPAEPGGFTERHWSRHKENPAVTAALYIPRLVWNLTRQVFTGEIAHRLANLAVGVYQTFRFGREDHWRKAAYRIADSPANPLALLNGAVSDAGASLKWARYSTGKTTSRIQACTANITSVISTHVTVGHFIMPATHVGVLVDGGAYETSDPQSSGALTDVVKQGGGLVCENVPILSGEPESLAIERLECVDQLYTGQSGYEFGGYNCGGYTKDILKWSGLGFPKFPNMGIGVHFGVGPAEGARRARRLKTQVVEHCDRRIRAIQRALRALERGETLDNDAWNYLMTDSRPSGGPVWMSSDVRLQFLVLAARGKNAENRIWISGWIYRFELYSKLLDAYYDDTPRGWEIKKSRRPFLKELFRGLDAEALAWLETVSPEASRLQRRLTGKESP